MSEGPSAWCMPSTTPLSHPQQCSYFPSGKPTHHLPSQLFSWCNRLCVPFSLSIGSKCPVVQSQTRESITHQTCWLCWMLSCAQVLSFLSFHSTVMTISRRFCVQYVCSYITVGDCCSAVSSLCLHTTCCAGPFREAFISHSGEQCLCGEPCHGCTGRERLWCTEGDALVYT